LAWDEEAVVRRLSGPLRSRHRLVQASAWSAWHRAGSACRIIASATRCCSGAPTAAWTRWSGLAARDDRAAWRRSMACLWGRQRGRGPKGCLLQRPSRWRRSWRATTSRRDAPGGGPLSTGGGALAARWSLTTSDRPSGARAGPAEGAPASGERLRWSWPVLEIVNPAMLGAGGGRRPTRGRWSASRSWRNIRAPGRPAAPRCAGGAGAAEHLVGQPGARRRVGEQLLVCPRSTSRRRQALMLAHWVLGHSYSLQGQFVAGAKSWSRRWPPRPGRRPFLSSILGADQP